MVQQALLAHMPDQCQRNVYQSHGLSQCAAWACKFECCRMPWIIQRGQDSWCSPSLRLGLAGLKHGNPSARQRYAGKCAWKWGQYSQLGDGWSAGASALPAACRHAQRPFNSDKWFGRWGGPLICTSGMPWPSVCVANAGKPCCSEVCCIVLR